MTICLVHNPPQRQIKVYPGARTLVAKTCFKCGLLKDAREFACNRGRYRLSECTSCTSERQIRWMSDPVNRERHMTQVYTHNVALQASSLTPETVEHRWQYWTDEEIAVALDYSKTAQQVATELNRTYKAVINARARYRS